MNFFKYINNKKGITLMEIVVTLALFSLVMVIIFPMTKVSSYALKEGQTELNQRSDIRNASEFLTDDVKYSKEIISATTGTLELTDKNDIVVKYYIDASDGYLKREVDGKVVQEFKDIMQADFQLENDNLVKTSFNKMTLPDDTEPKGQLEELKIARLNGKSNMFNGILGHIITNDFIITGSSTINGPVDGTIVVKNKFSPDNGVNPNLFAKNIYFMNGIDADAEAYIGPDDNSGNVYVHGDVSFKSSSYFNGKAILRDGNFYDSLRTKGEVYVNGDVKLENGSTYEVEGDIIYSGNIEKEIWQDVSKYRRDINEDLYKFDDPTVPPPDMPVIKEESFFDDWSSANPNDETSTEKLYYRGISDFNFKGIGAEDSPEEDIVIVSRSGNIKA
ncbi:MAG: prepilin-type N-terminal cleavage/methylation domain-containing protein, partial [Eubacteriales bacterium]